MPCKIVGGTKVPRNEKSWERKVQGTKVLSFPGNKSSRERKGPGTKVPVNVRCQGRKVPGNEKSPERKFPIGTIRSWERKVLGTKSPGTHEYTKLRTVSLRDVNSLTCIALYFFWGGASLLPRPLTER